VKGCFNHKPPHGEDRYKQSTDSRQYQPCAPLIYRITGGERVLQPQTTPQGRPTTSTNQLKVQNSDSLTSKRQTFVVWCVFCKKQTGKDINAQSTKWCCLLTWIKFKCQNCNVGFCFDPCLGVFMPHRNSEANISQGKADYIIVHFSLCTDIC